MPTSSPVRPLKDQLDEITAQFPQAIGSRIEAGVDQIEARASPLALPSATTRRTLRCPTPWDGPFVLPTCSPRARWS